MNSIKKILLFSLVALVAWSCTEDNGSDDNIRFEILPIASIDVPDTLESGNLNRINYAYFLPSDCHSFNNLYYIESGNERTLAVVNTVVENSTVLGCQPLVEVLDERHFDVLAPSGFNSLVFNVWQGQDEGGQDVYLTIEVPIE